MSHVLSRLSETEACGFEELFEDGDGSRAFLIVTFLAVLEMIRLKLVGVFQPAGTGPIRVYKRARPADATPRSCASRGGWAVRARRLRLCP